MENKQVKYTGPGLNVILTVVFIVLKLCKVIDWSWIWVLSPLWIGLILSVVLIVAALFVLNKL